MKRALKKIQEIRSHQNFKLFAAIGLLILALAAYLTVFNRASLIIVTDQPDINIFIDGKTPDRLKQQNQRYILTLNPGRHTVRILSPNTAEFAQTFIVLRGLKKTINPAFNLVSKTSTRTNDISLLQSGSAENTVVFLGDNGRTFYQYNIKTNQLTKLTNKPLTGILDVAWSPDINLALIKKVDGYFLYDLEHSNLIDQEVIKLSQSNETTMPIWNPIIFKQTNPSVSFDQKGIGLEEAANLKPEEIFRQIAYLKFEGENQFLILADQLNQNQEKVANFKNLVNPVLTWSPDSKYIAISSDNGLDLFSLQERKTVKLISDRSVSGALFSPDSQRIAFASQSLQIIDISGIGWQDLKVETEIKKISWLKDNRSILAAEYQPESSSDRLIKVSGVNGEIEAFTYESTEKLNIWQPILGFDESFVVFQSNHRLYYLMLLTDHQL